MQKRGPSSLQGGGEGEGTSDAIGAGPRPPPLVVPPVVVPPARGLGIGCRLRASLALPLRRTSASHARDRGGRGRIRPAGGHDSSSAAGLARKRQQVASAVHSLPPPWPHPSATGRWRRAHDGDPELWWAACARQAPAGARLQRPRGPYATPPQGQARWTIPLANPAGEAHLR